jgi:hypothetical protein
MKKYEKLIEKLSTLIQEEKEKIDRVSEVQNDK